MKPIMFNLFVIVLFLNLGTSSFAQNANASLDNRMISVDDFEKKTKEPNVLIVDVRTAEEFNSGYLKGAKNIDFYAKDFEQQIITLDKSKTILVYCLAGTRSAKAADILKKNDFHNVYSMKGGIVKWRLNDKPIIEPNPAVSTKGMTPEEFNAKIKGEKIFLVDLYAPWCPPCIKMGPIIEQVSNDLKDKIEVIKIGFDENKSLAKYLKIENFPSLFIYKNGKQVWRGDGVMQKEELEAIIKKY